MFLGRSPRERKRRESKEKHIWNYSIRFPRLHILINVTELCAYTYVIKEKSKKLNIAKNIHNLFLAIIQIRCLVTS